MAKTVLVTGGDRGIGRAIAEKFSSMGFAVAIAYEKNEEEAKKVCEATGCRAYRADVSDSAAVGRMFDSIERDMGPVDILVNNAGISVTGLFQDLSEEEWDRLFGVNVKGVFNCTKRALGGMIKKQCGCIINVSSMWGITGASCESHYSATKAAVIGYTQALARELGPSGIRVNCIAPGTTDTDMNAHYSKETMDELADCTPLGRIAEPSEIAEAAYFLASDASSYITGTVLNASGGFVI